MNTVQISECYFVDNLVISAGNEKDLRYNLEIWKSAPEAGNYTVSNFFIHAF